MARPKLSISCHCGAAKQTVCLQNPVSGTPQDIDLCHCSACRHNTGLLCVSYAGIERPDSVAGLLEYRTTENTTRFFCQNCGCQVFRRHQNHEESSLATAKDTQGWDVATGVIIGLNPGNENPTEERDDEILLRYARHINTASTKDGGLSPAIRRVVGSQDLEVTPSSPRPTEVKPEKLKFGEDTGDFLRDNRDGRGGNDQVLNAFCHCGSVHFHITRPDAASRLPRSNFPDLMVAYHTGSAQIQNPEDVKWWLRPGKGLCSTSEAAPSLEGVELDRYLAGTCACRSCRLASGFEIQTWAFVPRANIFFRVENSNRGLSILDSGAEVVPLDFATLPSNILTSYESSHGVRREFCSRCGATVFWRDRWRPELIDVSVGLLDSEGARAETWLDWWTERVSFAEDATLDRAGETARRAQCLVASLGDGLRKLGEKQ
ncbi:hypothetical protein F4777DRAFT_535908 [Nemania sp. FL0916]|nr:hypothetical protein F4777DRAFT_535908 [Nemania sp. FL0916]